MTDPYVSCGEYLCSEIRALLDCAGGAAVDAACVLGAAAVIAAAGYGASHIYRKYIR